MNKTTVTKLPKSLIEIKVEMPETEFAAFEEKALEEIAKEVEISGFRKGAASKEVVKNKVGQQKILDRAASIAIEASFPQAVLENKLEPLGYPEVSVLKLAQGNPFEYKAIVAVYPELAMPDYKQIAAGFEAKEPQVTEEDIKQLKMEKEHHMREHLRQDALAAVAAKTAVEIPEVLIERETQKTMAQIKERAPQVLHLSFEEYLAKLGQTEAELREQMAKDNEGKIRNYLVLQEIAKLEKIEAGDDEVASAVAKAMADEAAYAEGSGEPRAAGEIDVNNEQVRAYYRESLKTEKTFEFLENQFKKS
jgi:FKBP-type peptidyl-prolyl cis-trans isomerase (trigger factor)